MANQLDSTYNAVDNLEKQVVSFFVDGVKVLGLPRSIGEIYGLLFISQEPLALDDFVRRLEISKGSASQGLKMLKSLGAIREVEVFVEGSPERRAHYEPAVELKRLVGGFIGQQVRPHMDSGKNKIQALMTISDQIVDPKKREFLNDRLSLLERWLKNSNRVLPILQKILGQ